MDWLKKKKDEAKQAASQAAAKMQNKRTAFKGEGNVLGGDAAAAAAAAPSSSSSGNSFKLPFGSSAPPKVSEEEQKRRRELQLKAMEERGNNKWEKRVQTARKARLQEEGERFPDLPPPPATSSSATSSTDTSPRAVLSNEEVKARELQAAQAQMGFNPYAATFSSSTAASSIMNSIATSSTSAAPAGAMPPPGPVQAPAMMPIAAAEQSPGAVYVLLRQEPQAAITAAEVLLKMLGNIVANPTEEKYRKVRLSNASIQAKLVAVKGAIDILQEAGFTATTVDGESFMILSDAALDLPRVQSTLDRTEVALIQLQHDSAAT